MSVVFYLSGLSLITLGPPCSMNSSSSRTWQIKSTASSSLANLSSTQVIFLFLFFSMYAAYASCFSFSLKLLHQPSSRLVIATYLLPLDITLLFRSAILLSTHSYIVLAPPLVYAPTSLLGAPVTAYLYVSTTLIYRLNINRSSLHDYLPPLSSINHFISNQQTIRATNAILAPNNLSIGREDGDTGNTLPHAIIPPRTYLIALPPYVL